MSYRPRVKRESYQAEILMRTEQAIKKVHANAVTRIVSAAKMRAPFRFGYLKRSIGGESDDKGAYIYAGDEKAWYARIVEHRDPYLRPAIEENMGAVISDFSNELRNIAR